MKKLTVFVLFAAALLFTSYDTAAKDVGKLKGKLVAQRFVSFFNLGEKVGWRSEMWEELNSKDGTGYLYKRKGEFKAPLPGYKTTKLTEALTVLCDSDYSLVEFSYERKLGSFKREATGKRLEDGTLRAVCAAPDKSGRGKMHQAQIDAALEGSVFLSRTLARRAAADPAYPKAKSLTAHMLDLAKFDTDERTYYFDEKDHQGEKFAFHYTVPGTKEVFFTRDGFVLDTDLASSTLDVVETDEESMRNYSEEAPLRRIPFLKIDDKQCSYASPLTNMRLGIPGYGWCLRPPGKFNPITTLFHPAAGAYMVFFEPDNKDASANPFEIAQHASGFLNTPEHPMNLTMKGTVKVRALNVGVMDVNGHYPDKVWPVTGSVRAFFENGSWHICVSIVPEALGKAGNGAVDDIFRKRLKYEPVEDEGEFTLAEYSNEKFGVKFKYPDVFRLHDYSDDTKVEVKLGNDTLALYFELKVLPNPEGTPILKMIPGWTEGYSKWGFVGIEVAEGEVAGLDAMVFTAVKEMEGQEKPMNLTSYLAAYTPKHTFFVQIVDAHGTNKSGKYTDAFFGSIEIDPPEIADIVDGGDDGDDDGDGDPLFPDE